MEPMLRIEQVAGLVGVSVETVNIWYRFKAKDPENSYAKMLPEFTRAGTGKRTARLWKYSDVEKIVTFKQSIPKGRNGVLGELTRNYNRRTR